MSSTATVAKTRGPAFVVREGQETPLAQGMELLASDVVRTGLDAGCEFRFADGTDVQLGPMSLIRIDDFAYDPANTAEASFVMHMMEGMVKTVSGEVVKLNPEGFSLTTPLGTAGIRGTTVLTQVFPTHVVFLVTDMGAGHAVEVNSVFGGHLLILKPDMGAEINLTGHDRVTLLNGMPESMREAMESFFESELEDWRGSHDDYFLLMGDAGFLAAVGAENVSRGVGMLAADQADILVALLDDLGAETPEFFLQAPPDGTGGVTHVSYWGDANPNYLVPTQSVYGDDFQNINYDIRGYAGNDTIVGFNGQDVIYGGQGSQDFIYKITGQVTAGNLIVGGESSLANVATPDNDVIVLRALGASTDDEAGWTSQASADYGATTMSGGQVVGTAESLVNSGNGASGNTAISLYGSMQGGAIYGSAVTATNSRLGNSTITVNQGLDENNNLTGGDVSGSAVIYGDAQNISGGPNMASAGNDSIVVGSLGGNAAIYGDAAGGSYRAGNNTITVTDTMNGGAIHAGNGNDSVSVSIFDGGLIDLGSGMNSLTINTYNGGSIALGGVGGDQLTITTQNADLDIAAIPYGLFISAGAGAGAANNISVGAMAAGSFLYLNPGTTGKTLTVNSPPATGRYEINLGGGNTLEVRNAGAVDDIPVIRGDYTDSGTITNGAGGNNTITIDKLTNSNSRIFGDTSLNNSTGGKDAIEITGAMSSGEVYGDGGTLQDTSTGGNDEITINALSGGKVHGDAGELDASTGGKDIITITTTMSGGIVYGDANTLNNSTGGDDNITITTVTTTTSGPETHVYGDAYSLTTSTGGGDKITITTMDSGNVYGDVRTMGAGCLGGNDTITITTMNGGEVRGDAYSMSGDARGGNDSITIGTMYGGYVYGDANYLNDNSTGGNDTIKVTTMHAGTIYGDSGNDEITISTVAGTAAKTIWAGSGADTVKISKLASGADGFGMNLGSDSNADYLDLRGIQFEGSKGTFYVTVNGFETADDKIVYTASEWSGVPVQADTKFTLTHISENTLILYISNTSTTNWDAISTQTIPIP